MFSLRSVMIQFTFSLRSAMRAVLCSWGIGFLIGTKRNIAYVYICSAINFYIINNGWLMLTLSRHNAKTATACTSNAWEANSSHTPVKYTKGVVKSMNVTSLSDAGPEQTTTERKVAIIIHRKTILFQDISSSEILLLTSKPIRWLCWYRRIHTLPSRTAPISSLLNILQLVF